MAIAGAELIQTTEPAAVGAVDFNIMLHEADVGAQRLARRLELPDHDRDDILHELIVDLLVRAKAFRPSRGSMGAFAGTVIRHRATRIARRIRREKRFVAETTKPAFVDAEGGQLDGAQEVFEYAHDLLQNEASNIESRIDLKRALAGLSSNDINLCGALIDLTPTEISRESGRSRASVYRAIKKIRTQILRTGISIAA